MYAFDCGMDDCPVCLPEYRRGKVWRYRHGMGKDEQTIITVDCPDAATASDVRRYFTNKYRVPHVSVVTPYPDDDDERVTVTCILADALTDSRTELAYALAADRFPSLPLSIDQGRYEPSEFAELIITQHKVNGVLKPVSFARWVKVPPTDPDYQFADPETLTVFVEPIKEKQHHCPGCDATRKQYPTGKNLSPATRAINREKRNEVWAKLWLDGMAIDYHDMTDLANGDKEAYNRIRVASHYSGPRSLIADTAKAIDFDPNCASPHNPRGAYLPPTASLAMLLVMQHVTIGG
ncbi:MAG: hypothetical protein OXF79_12150 [Chloroflexi bacterium]|nr:hypothetical protein [Chloroflexota bacterium]